MKNTWILAKKLQFFIKIYKKNIFFYKIFYKILFFYKKNFRKKFFFIKIFFSKKFFTKFHKIWSGEGSYARRRIFYKFCKNFFFKKFFFKKFFFLKKFFLEKFFFFKKFFIKILFWQSEVFKPRTILFARTRRLLKVHPIAFRWTYVKTMFSQSFLD